MCDDMITITLPAKVAVRIVQQGALIEKHNIGRDTFYTTSLFWDCECEEDYIQPAFRTECILCGVRREDQPDARVDEVLKTPYYLPVELKQVVEVLADKICPHLTAILF